MAERMVTFYLFGRELLSYERGGIGAIIYICWVSVAMPWRLLVVPFIRCSEPEGFFRFGVVAGSAVLAPS